MQINNFLPFHLIIRIQRGTSIQRLQQSSQTSSRVHLFDRTRNIEPRLKLESSNMGILRGHCSKTVQAIMIIVLCIVFLKFFGLSTLDKWERQDVQIVHYWTVWCPVCTRNFPMVWCGSKLGIGIGIGNHLTNPI